MKSADLVIAERTRQIEEEGYKPVLDIGSSADLARAAASYALPDPGSRRQVNFSDGSGFIAPRTWPWPPRYWKPTPQDRKRELVKAGALILAALDALDGEQAGS